MILLEGNTCVEKNLQELHVLLLLTNKIRMTFFQKPTEVLHIFYENNFPLGKYLLCDFYVQSNTFKGKNLTFEITKQTKQTSLYNFYAIVFYLTNRTCS